MSKEGRKTAADYTTPHDLAIKAANWAMKEDPECEAASRSRSEAKRPYGDRRRVYVGIDVRHG
jgi:hypothetical protein